MLPKIRKILFATRWGPNAGYVFRYALGLAKDLGGEVMVLHVVETLNPRQEALVEGYVGRGTLHHIVEQVEAAQAEVVRAKVAEFCREVLRDPGCEGLVREVVVAEGDPAEQIVTHARQWGADLVVLAAHAERTFLDAIVGSTARKVVETSPVPVLTVHVPGEVPSRPQP
ncbi:universal stress protein [Deferrisoma palaeochoriense]